ncbi:hypothetical protein PRJ39_02930 [Lysobacter enzymogenes]|uniref:hypothetical protein n=1 Tax=Lysobacter enzymogenes TaxID=69 RepID=UPI003749FA44
MKLHWDENQHAGAAPAAHTDGPGAGPDAEAGAARGAADGAEAAAAAAAAAKTAAGDDSDGAPPAATQIPPEGGAAGSGADPGQATSAADAAGDGAPAGAAPAAGTPGNGDAGSGAPADGAGQGGGGAGGGGDAGNGAAGSGDDSGSRLPQSPLAAARGRALTRSKALMSGSAAPPDTSALNTQIVQAVQFTNAETASYAPAQIATNADMMISQAAGLVAQSAAAYFDGVTKIALASQGVLMKQLTQDIVAGNVTNAAEDAIGILATDVFMGVAAAVAAAAGAMEAESAKFAIDAIDSSISKYTSVLQNSGAK